MVLIVGRGHTRNNELIINRTGQSGGSIGGNTKAGTVYYGPSWFRTINSLNRASKKPFNVEFALATSTKNPVQRTGSQYVLVHGSLG